MDTRGNRVGITVFVAFVMLIASVMTTFAYDETEFVHPTVDFAKPHYIRAGISLCRLIETFDVKEGRIVPDEECYTLRKREKFKIKFVAHGITAPRFWAEPLNNKLRSGFVRRQDIED